MSFSNLTNLDQTFSYLCPHKIPGGVQVEGGRRCTSSIPHRGQKCSFLACNNRDALPAKFAATADVVGHHQPPCQESVDLHARLTSAQLMTSAGIAADADCARRSIFGCEAICLRRTLVDFLLLLRWAFCCHYISNSVNKWLRNISFEFTKLWSHYLSKKYWIHSQQMRSIK